MIRSVISRVGFTFVVSFFFAESELLLLTPGESVVPRPPIVPRERERSTARRSIDTTPTLPSTRPRRRRLGFPEGDRSRGASSTRTVTTLLTFSDCAQSSTVPGASDSNSPVRSSMRAIEELLDVHRISGDGASTPLLVRAAAVNLARAPVMISEGAPAMCSEATFTPAPPPPTGERSQSLSPLCLGRGIGLRGTRIRSSTSRDAAGTSASAMSAWRRGSCCAGDAGRASMA